MDVRKVFTPLEVKIVSQRSGRVLRKSRKSAWGRLSAGRLAAESLGLTGVTQSSIGFSIYTCSAGWVLMRAEF